MADEEPFMTTQCGGRVTVVYVWKNNKLLHSAIAHRTRQEILHGSNAEGHFIVRATKAVVRTSHNPKGFAKPTNCTVRIRKYPGAPNVTNSDIEAIMYECEMSPREKRRQLKVEKTYPVVLEKSKVKNVLAKTFPEKLYTVYPAKPHDASLMYVEHVREMEEYEAKCHTANIVTCHPPLAVFYGPGYAYQMHLKPSRAGHLVANPITVVIFYGEIYETPNKHFTGNPLNYFSGLIPEPYEPHDPAPGDENTHRNFESDVDDYAYDTSEDEPEDEYFKRTPEKVNYGTRPNDYKLKDGAAELEHEDDIDNHVVENEGFEEEDEGEWESDSDYDEASDNEQEHEAIKKNSGNSGNDKQQDTSDKPMTWANVARVKPKRDEHARAARAITNAYHNQ